MSITKKLVIAVVAMAVAMCCMIGGTIAWLTSKPEAVVNTFTVGDIKITLDESKVTPYGVVVGDTRVMENIYRLIPGQLYTKDPTVHVDKNVTNEKCYIFIKVENGIADIEANDAGNDTITEQIVANQWTAHDASAGIYYKVFDPETETNVDLIVFESFKIASTISKETIAAYNGKTVKVTAYAIQYLGFEADVAAAWAAVSAAANG